MLFPTIEFAIFFVIVFFASWALKAQLAWRKVVLVAASYIFYAAWDWRFCFLLAGSSLLNYLAGLIIDRSQSAAVRKWTLAAAIVVNLGALGFFKYFDFFIESLNDLFFSLGLERELPYMAVILPVGISFFTFQGISYIVDIYRRDIRASSSALDVFLYISFFPQLVAGPIVRASTLIPQITAKPDPSAILMSWGVVLVLIGLFKKMIIANYLATELVDHVFFDPTMFGTLDLLIGAYGYAVQIYCDFSGYSDIAIGIAAMLGYRFDKNFDQPYRASSIREFWRRWHISLSSWLRDYLYIPLGGNRHGPWKTRRNLLLTMLLGGIWHGAAWTFVVWGLMHGLALAVENALTRGRQLARRAFAWRLAGWVYAFHFVVLAFIFFRAESIGYAWEYLEFMVTGSEPMWLATPFVIGLVVLGLGIQFIRHDAPEAVSRGLSRMPVVVQGLIAGLGVVAIGAMGPDGVAPFIYFQF